MCLRAVANAIVLVSNKQPDHTHGHSLHSPRMFGMIRYIWITYPYRRAPSNNYHLEIARTETKLRYMLDVSVQTFVIPPVTWLTSRLLSGSSITGIDISIMLPECSGCMYAGGFMRCTRARVNFGQRKSDGSILIHLQPEESAKKCDSLESSACRRIANCWLIRKSQGFEIQENARFCFGKWNYFVASHGWEERLRIHRRIFKQIHRSNWY